MTWPLSLSESADRVLCVGIDPHPAVLEMWGCPDSPVGLATFSQQLPALLEEAGCRVVKPQVAFFERHGVKGMQTLAELLGELRRRDIATIGDAKRGDIGSTMVGYAQAWLVPGADFEVDALTLVPYQGLGALEPALSLSLGNSKGVFVLAATSNPEARETQMARTPDGVSVASSVMGYLRAWTEAHPGSRPTHGVVLGATMTLSAYGISLSDFPGMPILAPGYGHQGAKLGEARASFPATSPLFAVVARSVLMEGPERFVDAVDGARKEFSE
ncbi:MAG: orotidine-5'-phosphate decarboxylase [Microbacteriaceae bacterium]|nr:orotidine-5'-phosphate decarboxylase [Microbacteriaceae bacterium]